MRTACAILAIVIHFLEFIFFLLYNYPKAFIFFYLINLALIHLQLLFNGDQSFN